MDTTIEPSDTSETPPDSRADASEATSSQYGAPTAETPAATPSGPSSGFSPPGYGPPPGYGWGGWPAPGPWGAGPEPAATERGGLGAFLRSATTAWVVAGVLALAVVGLSVALASANTTTNAVRVARPFGGSGTNAGGLTPGSGGFGGSGPFGGAANLGVFGTVASVESGSFTVTDATGQAITVDEQSSTVYYSGRTTSTSSAVTTGSRVAVQGTRSANTVTATRVIVLPAGGFGPAAAG